MSVKIASYSVIRVWPHQSGVIFATCDILFPGGERAEVSYPVDKLENHILRFVKTHREMLKLKDIPIMAEL